ncbi:hypothetical protein [Erythrobacter sp. SD-21]|uniref:hypothetical protein n=1 Tax=Erythrobacter sp. SD-21 TaxID=161528 RepID=UPI000153F88E|nr:hypothetical protein [Erythrobacter sp. SD-21]EDL48755.1 hypothetical protein ED21_23531 [Erythrobacter sp. SD-21]
MSTFTLLPLLLLSTQSDLEPRNVPVLAAEDSVYVNQTSSDSAESASLKAFLPTTAEKATNPPASDDKSLEGQTLENPRRPDQEMVQLSARDREMGGTTDQLTRERGRRALAQLTERDRAILFSAVNGTDICEREPSNPAIIELCLVRLEDRSEEFAGNSAPSLSPEERLLGEGLDSDRVATLESAISRLARGNSALNSNEDQAIASVALGSSTLAPAQPTSEEPNPSELSAETQALINAIVEQFSTQAGGGL